MKIIQATSSVAGLLKKRGCYLVENVNAGEFMARDQAEVLDKAFFGDVFARTAGVTRDGTPLVIIRPGGFGDLLAMRASLLSLLRDPQVGPLAVCCMKTYRPALAGLWEKGLEWLPYPLPLHLLKSRWWVSLENCVEREPMGREMSLGRLWSSLLQAETDNIEDSYPVPQEAATLARMAMAKVDRYGSKKAPWIAVHCRSSALCRTYPKVFMQKVIELLLERGHYVAVVGAAGEVPMNREPTGILNFTQRDGFESFEAQAAVMAQCDVFLGPDSALLHLAGLLGKPGVGLFGPIPSKLRVADYPGIKGIDGSARCAPCFHHVRGGLQWPANGPCQQTGRCEALASIHPTRVVVRVEKALGLGPIGRFVWGIKHGQNRHKLCGS